MDKGNYASARANVPNTFNNVQSVSYRKTAVYDGHAQYKNGIIWHLLLTFIIYRVLLA